VEHKQEETSKKKKSKGGRGENAMAMTIEWEWMTDDLRWKPYTAACSAAIEAAYNAGESSVNLCIQSTSGFTHSITFKAQPPVQVRKTPFPLSLSSCLVF
jgi:hypothetical protein